MVRRHRAMSLVTLLFLGLSISGAALRASEEGPASSTKEIVLECKAGAVTEKISSASPSATVSVPGCYCADEPGSLKSWLSSEAEKWQAGQALSEPPASDQFSISLTPAPGEQVDITLYCLTPGQVAEYRNAVLAEAEDSSGDS